jgi:(p)ppGpp synthase/HD superfamily hydrolase
MTKKAMKFMFEHQKEQYDKSGIPYVFHPFTVAYELTNENECTIALLHDVIEDTNVTFEDLKKEGFPDIVIDTLKLLTHEEGIDYFEYIDKISKNKLARNVKIQDLKHNMQEGRLNKITDKDIERKEKYIKALNILEGVNYE